MEGKDVTLVARLQARRERHLARSRAYRIVFAAAGFAVLVVGVVLIPLPGPGWLIIAAGLAMLALEFAWAAKLLERVLARLERFRRPRRQSDERARG